MSENSRRFDPARKLIEYAEHLNAIRSASWRAKVFYEYMSGALIWSDETNNETPTEVICSLRIVFAYRTSLMLNQPRDDLKPMWDLGLEHFPKWVGFRPARRMPTPRLLKIYQRGVARLNKDLTDIEL